ncbi:40S ribosomal protein S12, mitochondrial [Eufriesea mexicana]|uniref:Small ribosomal subunit protein uS12m n=1 Tax=Eufriesea mexicana TaxID=516756 RepID=A0A310SP68_9HYME|nr:40S ribosomal protein S12, mitochondrial [Eufriesea mexicana]
MGFQKFLKTFFSLEGLHIVLVVIALVAPSFAESEEKKIEKRGLLLSGGLGGGLGHGGLSLGGHGGFAQVRLGSTLYRLHKYGDYRKQRKKKKNPLDGKPFAKGVVLKTLIRKPKKPNSANRKCVLVRLSTGKEMVAFIPGVGHNLQEHNMVLCRPGKLKDTPGVKIRCVRGKYDLGHPIKTT